jgi:hypothetical protein
MFNDSVQMGFFDVYDQYLVNILYDPRVRPGMMKREVDALLPDIFPTVRAWVVQTNSVQAVESHDELNGGVRLPVASGMAALIAPQQRR